MIGDTSGFCCIIDLTVFRHFTPCCKPGSVSAQPVSCPHVRGWLLWHFPSHRQGKMTEHKEPSSASVQWCPATHFPSVLEEGVLDLAPRNSAHRKNDGWWSWASVELSRLVLPCVPTGFAQCSTQISTTRWVGAPRESQPLDPTSLFVCSEVKLSFRASQL